MKRSGQCERRETECGAPKAASEALLFPLFTCHWLTSPKSVSFSILIPLGLSVAFDITQLCLFLKIFLSLDLIHTEFAPCVSHASFSGFFSGFSYLIAPQQHFLGF